MLIAHEGIDPGHLGFQHIAMYTAPWGPLYPKGLRVLFSFKSRTNPKSAHGTKKARSRSLRLPTLYLDNYNKSVIAEVLYILSSLILFPV